MNCTVALSTSLATVSLYSWKSFRFTSSMNRRNSKCPLPTDVRLDRYCYKSTSDNVSRTMLCQKPRATLQGAATWQIQCRVIPEPRVTVQGAAACHLANLVSRSQSHVSHCRVLPPGIVSDMIPDIATTVTQSHDSRVRSLCFN